ncbi:MAG: beta-N-acetylhexosaminidase [Nitrospiria bacterium]
MKTVQKIGQFMMAGFEGTTPSKEIRELIKKRHVGGVILFSRNIENPAQCIKLTKSLQKLSPDAPLLIAVDQEGGRVSRFPASFTPFPSARTVGRCDSVSHTYRLGEAISKELLAVGINMNFAPVLDVDTNPKNPIIGDRSFGSSPTLVSKHGLSMIAAMLDCKVIPCGKHFPGHGDTDLDSHEALPRVQHAIIRLTDLELRPFVHAIENRLPCVMTAHICCTAFDDTLPASLSKNVVTELLRKTMKYDGVVITDDLEMRGVSDSFTVAEAAVRALQVGSDIVLVCHSYEQQTAALDAMLSAVEKGEISEARLEKSLGRILALKEHFLLQQNHSIMKALRETIGSEDHRDLVETIEKRGKA